MIFDTLSPSILGPAFIAGLLVLSTHVPLGYTVLARGIVFIDLAIAQIAGLGVLTADYLGYEAQGIAVQLSAISAALIGALLLHLTERRWPQIQEALIGVLFVVASCVGILLLAGNPHGGEHLRDLLVGQILWVAPKQLQFMAILSLAIIAFWIYRRNHDAAGRLSFYASFALVVTASVQLVGVYLVFASLILPALATRSISSTRTRLIGGYLVGIMGYALGLILSALFDLPSGAVIVLTMSLVALLTSLICHVFNEKLMDS